MEAAPNDRPTTIYIRGGSYFSGSGEPVLNAADVRRSSGAPLTIASYPADIEKGKSVLLSAGKPVPPSAFRLLAEEDSWAAARLPTAAARAAVVVADLKSCCGISDYGALAGHFNTNLLELFAGGEPLRLARYPNVDADDQRLWRWQRATGGSGPTFGYSGDRPSQKNWTSAEDAWVVTYSKFDWLDFISPIKQIDTSSQEIMLGGSPNGGWVSGARWLAFNLLEELDEAGEYWVDRAQGKLYVFPLGGQGAAVEDAFVSMHPVAVDLSSAERVSLVGPMEIAHARDTAVEATGVKSVTVSGVTARNSGSVAIKMSGASDSVLQESTLSGVGNDGSHVGGGDLASLTPGNVLMEGNLLFGYSRWKRTYQPGVRLSGVGNMYRRNTFRDAPHQAFSEETNDCIYEYNVIKHLGYETADSGAWYQGKSWSKRGNILRYNHFEDIRQHEEMQQAASSAAIYFDDQLSGNIVYGNTFVDCDMGILIGGGRSHTVYNNTFIRTNLAVHLGNRGETWQTDLCQRGEFFEQELQSVNYQQPPWSEHYPGIAEIMSDSPCKPVHNSIYDNRYCRTGDFIDADPPSSWDAKIYNNAQFNDCDGDTVVLV